MNMYQEFQAWFDALMFGWISDVTGDEREFCLEWANDIKDIASGSSRPPVFSR